MSDEQTNSPKIRKFSGHHGEYPAYRIDVLAHFARASDACENGLLSILLSEEEYVPRENDPVFGGLVPPAKPVAINGKFDELAFFEYKESKAAYSSFKKDEKKACQALLGSADEATAYLMKAMDNYINLNAAEILAIMDDIFLKVTPRTLDENWQILAHPFTDISKIREHLAEFDLIFNLFEKNNQPICEYLKVKLVLDAVRNLGALTEAVNHFNSRKTEVAERLYSSLSKKLLTAVVSLPIAPYVPPVNPYQIGSVTPSRVPPARGMPGAPAQLLTPKAANRNDKSANANNTKASAGTKSSHPARTDHDVYCWMHGCCRHKMEDCTAFAQLTSYQLGATFADRRGGSDFKCENK